MTSLEGIEVTVLLRKDVDHPDVTVSVPLIPNLVTQAPSIEEALKEARSEISHYVECDPNLLEELKSQPEFELSKIIL